MRRTLHICLISLGFALLVAVHAYAPDPSQPHLRDGSPDIESDASTSAAALESGGVSPDAPIRGHSGEADPTTRTIAARDDTERAVPIVSENLPPSGPALRRILERAIEETRFVVPLSVDAPVIDQIVDRGEVRVVFAIDRDVTRPTLVATLARLGGRLSNTDLRFFPLVGHAGARVEADTLVALIRSGITPRIELDRVHRASLGSSLPVIATDLAHAAGADGDGKAIAVLDTGVDTTHPMFAGRIVEEACFSLLGDCPNAGSVMVGPGAAISCSGSGCGHGTAVAGIALGHMPDDTLTGVAPAASLIAIQIFSLIDGEIGAYSSDILAGLQHVLALAPLYDIAAVNLSLGGALHASAAACDAASSAQFAAVDMLRAQGIATVAAAGNDGRIDQISSPACLSNVIGVSATRDDDSITHFTNHADLVSIFAPGSSIETAARGGATTLTSGTSMSTPHVTGAIAAIREVHPGASVAEMENALVISGVPVYDDRNEVTTPRIDVHAALEFIAMTAPPPPNDTGSISGEANGSANPPASVAGSGGGACGLVGLEPFLAIVGVRLTRRWRRGPRRRPVEDLPPFRLRAS